MLQAFLIKVFFFFNDTATTEIYTLSLHDALPISRARTAGSCRTETPPVSRSCRRRPRSEEHTSELQSRLHLVCRLLLEKKNVTASEVFGVPRAEVTPDLRRRAKTIVVVVAYGMSA